MRCFFVSLFILFSVVFLTGMGELGGTPEGTVPETSENIKALIVDRSDITTELSQFSMDGNVFLAGTRGSGKLTINFENIKKVEMGKPAGDQYFAVIELKSGQSLQLKISKRAIFYGSTGYGAYQVRTRDIKRIEFP